MILYEKYDKYKYPKYDYYDAINCDKVAEIPIDYKGKIAVPIRFLERHNPNQFEIIDCISSNSLLYKPTNKNRGKYLAQIGDRRVYKRIIIKRRN